MKITRYCTCGAGFEGTVPQGSHDQLLAIWTEAHAGEGHQPCSRRAAVRAYQENTGDTQDPFVE